MNSLQFTPKQDEPVSDAPLHFEDFFNLEEIQTLQDAIRASTGLASLITRPDGTPITRPSNFTHLCNSIIRTTKKGLSRCMISDAALGKFDPDGANFQPCMIAGLLDGGTAIMFGNIHVANWLIGQVIPAEADLDELAQYGETIGADPNEYRNALEQIPRRSLDRFSKIAHTLHLFGKMLSKQAMQNHELNRNVQEMIAKEF